MCGIAGIVNFTEKINTPKNIKKTKNMTNTLKRRGPDAEGIFVSENVLLGHRRLAVVDVENGAQPMTITKNGRACTIVYNGELYNTPQLKRDLEEKGYIHKTNSDTETLLLGYMCYGEAWLNKLIGIFAFCIYDHNKNNVFLARDNFGVKPFFYAKKNNTFIFASQQDSLLKSEYVKPEIDEVGLKELFGLNPSRTNGLGLFKNIFELKSGEMAIFDKTGLHKKMYYKIEAIKHTDSKEKTIEKVRNLVLNSVSSQLVSDVPLCTFLSGGLDSSIITAVASKKLKEEGKTLNTYSIDYEGNSKYFKKSLFQPTEDRDYIEIMSNHFNTKHHYYTANSEEELAKSIIPACIYRSVPGMADIDSSLMNFCEEVKKDFTVALSGECADEIFGGYPWFSNKKLINKNFFPWMDENSERLYVLKDDFKNKIKPMEYARQRYAETIKNTPLLGNESKEEKRLKQIQYLNIKWFMQNLLERKDMMSMANGLEVRVPFCDRRIVDYVYNIPFELKLLNGREKGLLREAVKDILPKQILTRKKAPYPKTHNPKYYTLMLKELNARLKNKNSVLKEFLDIKKLEKLLETSPNLANPWFGQLMARPQLIANLIQVDEWFNYFNVNIV